MQYGRRETDFPKQKLITGVFYYLSLFVLICFLLTGLYWQIEKEEVQFKLQEFQVVSTPTNRSFFVPVYFCADNLTELTLIRFYQDIDRNLYYGVPDSIYKTSLSGCFDTRVQASTGGLEPGNYVYHVSVSYPLNPLRTIRQPVAVVKVTVE